MSTPNGFTPGPWEVQKLNHVAGELWLQVGQNGLGPIARVRTDVEPMQPGVVAELKCLATDREEQWANAHLIAAAPDLLAACRAALTRFSEQNGDVWEEVWIANYPAMRALRDAVARAEGQRVSPAPLR